jgi:hypothetical protein
VSDDTNLSAEAGAFSYSSTGQTYAEQATLTFMDTNPAYVETVDSQLNDTIRNATNDDAVSYSDFFKRPVQINKYEWLIGDNVPGSIKPWDLWAKNKRVANRLNNFRNFRGKLHLKFVVQGNAFYFGRMMMSYTPFNYSPFVRYNNNPLDAHTASQRPHIYLDPATSQGGEMVLPFFYPHDCLDMTVSGAFASLGDLWYLPLVQLSHTQNLTQDLRIVLYAWVDDIQLSTPTSVPINGLSAQSGEYDTKPASKVQSVVAKASGMLQKAPAITEMALSTLMAVGQLAAMFGFSRPRNIDKVGFLQKWQTGNLASTDDPDTCRTLGFTQKNETTVDPRTVGLGSQDELSFEYLAGIESIYTSFDWELADGFLHPLFSTAVTPLVCSVSAYTIPPTAPATSYAPMGMVALPFDYWRGSITYRFQVCCSGYHRGRLLLVWDPVLASTVPEVNTVYSRIVDIGETKDFEITVGWGSPRPALFTDHILGSSNTFSTGSLFAPNLQTQNGVLSAYVLNDLVTSGANTDPVHIIVSVSSKDLQVIGPNADNLREVTFHQKPVVEVREVLEAESGEVSDDPVSMPEGAEPMGPIASVGPALELTHIVSSEVVTSFRMCMKRYSLQRVIDIPFSKTAADIVRIAVTGNSYPIYRGNVPAGQFGTFNDVPTNMFNYVPACFAQWKGSTRWKIFDLNKSLDTYHGLNPELATISRGNANNSAGTATSYVSDVTNLRALVSSITESWSGEQVTSDANGRVFDFELPYYASVRSSTCHSTVTSEGLGWTLSQLFFPSADDSGDVASRHAVHVATGEDYNLFFFLGVPPMWWDATLPATP